jgi:hypothetical protein
MTDEPRRRVSGSDVAGAGFLGLAVTLACIAIGTAVGIVVGALAPLVLAGFGVGFVLGIGVVISRFRAL